MTEDRGITLGLLAMGAAGAKGGRTTPRRDRSFERFLRLVNRVGSWLGARKDRVSDGYFVRTPEGLALYLVGTAEAYDFGLSEELSKFAAPLISREWLTGATLLPASTPDELAAIFDAGDALLIKVG